MRRVFLPPESLSAESVVIEGPDHHHLVNVLRVRVGEPLILLDNQGGVYDSEIAAIEKRTLTARRIGPAEVAPEPPVHITVAQALGKGDKFEQVVQHATEAGASAFIALSTERAVVRLDARTSETKRERWHLIAKAAAEQSGRSRIPRVEPVASLTDLSKRFADYALVLLLHPEGERLPTILSVSPCLPVSLSPCLLLLVGPEGGFSPVEVERARAAGARIVSLGPYTLRTETAALVAISQILYHESMSP